MLIAKDIQKLGVDLRQLMKGQLRTACEVRDWYDRAQEVYSYISANPELSNVVPEIIWHYLSDADIRFKDREYARVHLDIMETVVRDLERGRLPL